MKEKFNTYDKIAELIDGGDISCCDSDTDWNLEKVESHIQYYNDRGEKTEPRLDTTVEDYLANGEEYAIHLYLDQLTFAFSLISTI